MTVGYTALAVASLVATAGGCANYPQDLRAHEERHCEGWTHTGNSPFYVWTQTLPASVKPWLYVYAADVDLACRMLGAQAIIGSSIYGCAQWKPANCIIILPEGI